MRTLNILFIISEADPLIKVGGLGDVGGTLPFALQQLQTDDWGYQNIDIRVVIPYHDKLKKNQLPSEWITNFKLQTQNGFQDVYVSKALNTEVPIYLIDGDPVRNTAIYSDDTHRDLEKYAFFAIAGLEMCRKIGWKPDILHAHDWHTAVAVKKLKQIRPFDPFFSNTRSLYTIHNLPYSGGNHPDILEKYEVMPAYEADIPYYLRYLPMAVGLGAADHISTVSNTYANEITTDEFGHGYQTYLKNHRDRLSGIVNGIMMDQWNPATDTVIFQQFDQNLLEKRPCNKKNIQQLIQLPENQSVPLFAMVGRMSYQKGFDICIESLRRMVDLDWQIIILGTGEAHLEAMCKDLERQYPNRVRVELRYDAKLARKLYASGDLFLMPSRYEPCGIAQMISMLYGCVPVASATGGLKDTIRDPENYPDTYTGFLFRQSDSYEAESVMRRAIDCFGKPELWKEIQLRGMVQDFSWEKQAKKYLDLYQKILGQA